MSRRIAVAAAAWLVAATTSAAELVLPRDGWVSWQVPSIRDAPAFCCWHWGDQVRSKSCDLDGNKHGYNSRDDERTDAVRVYVKLESGTVQKLRTLAAACPATARTPVQVLDNVSADASANWLENHLSRADLADDVLLSLAVHEGKRADDAMKRVARQDASPESREKALFWLATVRGGTTAEVESLVREAARTDKSDDVRDHAVFVLSQLPGERGTQALIAMAEDHDATREQRKRALFWLAQSESASAVAYLDRVLTRAAR